MPLEAEKGREGTPLTRIENKAEEVRFKIQFTQSWSKPKEFKIALRYCQLALSKAFERSSLINIPGVFVYLRESISSCAKMMLSIICLPLT